jgi:AcrR family transcriptional regulator
MHETALRREPRQPRGQRRVESILDAAEQLFARSGYTEVTTNAIAAEAHTSVGSLYQFFPNKEAIVQGLADRYLQQLHEIQARAFQAEALSLPLRDWIGRVVDLLFELQDANPGFTAIFCDLPPNSDALQAVYGLYKPLIEGGDALLARRAPDLDPAQRAIHVQVCVTVIKALMPLCATPEARAAIVPELKVLLVRYLEPLYGRD